MFSNLLNMTGLPDVYITSAFTAYSLQATIELSHCCVLTFIKETEGERSRKAVLSVTEIVINEGLQLSRKSKQIMTLGVLGDDFLAILMWRLFL